MNDHECEETTETTTEFLDEVSSTAFSILIIYMQSITHNNFFLCNKREILKMKII